ncbi:MAG: DUF2197 domain-containing protein [Thermaerobacter sp.]|nr:DUF2197 domain-containing protein [Thermaerobacter sp.]
MEVRCSICGRADTLEKWEAEHERQRQGSGPYVCEACQRRVQQESLQATKLQKPL